MGAAVPHLSQALRLHHELLQQLLLWLHPAARRQLLLQQLQQHRRLAGCT
jgi:hypothetical protein